MKRRLSILLVTLVICTLVAGPALAAPPDQFTVPMHEVWAIQDCGDFWVLADNSWITHWTVFFDQTGVPVRWGLHLEASIMFYNSTRDPSTGLPGTGRFNWNTLVVDGHMDYARGGGLWMKLFVPGVGNVYMETGHVVYQWNGSDMEMIGWAGQHPWRLGEFVPALCEVLAD